MAMRRWAMTMNMTMRAAVAVTAQPGGGHREQPAGAKNQADQIDTHVGTEANAKPMYPGETQAIQSPARGRMTSCRRRCDSLRRGAPATRVHGAPAEPVPALTSPRRKEPKPDGGGCHRLAFTQLRYIFGFLTQYPPIAGIVCSDPIDAERQENMSNPPEAHPKMAAEALIPCLNSHQFRRKCPECGAQVTFASACVACPACGWGRCG